MKLRIIRALSPKSLFNLVDIYSCFFDYIISFSLNKLMCPVLIWKYQNAMTTIGNSQNTWTRLVIQRNFRLIFSLRFPCSRRYGSSLVLYRRVRKVVRASNPKYFLANRKEVKWRMLFFSCIDSGRLRPLHFSDTEFVIFVGISADSAML